MSRLGRLLSSKPAMPSNAVTTKPKPLSVGFDRYREFDSEEYQ